MPEHENNNTKTNGTDAVRTIRVGLIRVGLWENGKGNNPWYNVRLWRRYKNDDGNWESTPYLRRDDLLGASKALEMAFDWIHEQQAALGEDRNAAS